MAHRVRAGDRGAETGGRPKAGLEPFRVIPGAYASGPRTFSRVSSSSAYRKIESVAFPARVLGLVLIMIGLLGLAVSGLSGTPKGVAIDAEKRSERVAQSAARSERMSLAQLVSGLSFSAGALLLLVSTRRPS
ncbi:MAG: hypothetical protein ACREOU_05355 [Candidatus Eiseniibacteriota bacterium]